MRTVGALRSIAVTYRLILRQLVTTGRVVALGGMGVAVALIGWAAGSASDDSGLERLEEAVGLVSLVAFTVVVPIISLVFAAASLGDPREDGTLVYLWLRPMHRWSVVVGAWLAALTVSLPLTVVPSTLFSIFLDSGGVLVEATVVAAIVGVVAYSALFVLLGLLVKNAIVWGLGYIVIWEGVVAGFGSAAEKVAIRGYANSVLTGRAGVDLELGTLSQTTGVVVPVIIVVVALAVASFRLDHLEVA